MVFSCAKKNGKYHKRLNFFRPQLSNSYDFPNIFFNIRYERVQKRAPVVKSGRFNPNVNVLMPEDVTEAMIGR